jgi:hypothetical protein
MDEEEADMYSANGYPFGLEDEGFRYGIPDEYFQARASAGD